MDIYKLMDMAYNELGRGDNIVFWDASMQEGVSWTIYALKSLCHLDILTCSFKKWKQWLDQQQSQVESSILAAFHIDNNLMI